MQHDPTADVDFSEQVLALQPGMRILDLAAGWGRTSLELARRGYLVTAFDLSPELVALGRERAAAAGLQVTFVQGTARQLPALGHFDAVCAFYDDCLLSFEAEADNLAALVGVARSLRPGGMLLFGTTDCPPTLPPMQRTTHREAGETIMETITFDAASRIGTSVRTHVRDMEAVEQFVRQRRHYRPLEAAALLARAGFSVTGMWCAYNTDLPHGCRDEGMVIAARWGSASAAAAYAQTAG